MPHECTDCGRVFEDGSTEMLSGCPDCGGTTFQFRPDGAESSSDSAEPPETPEPDVDRVTRTVGNAASAVRNLVGDSKTEGKPGPARNPDGELPDADEAPDTGEDGGETSSESPTDSRPGSSESPTDSRPGSGETSTEWPGEDGFRIPDDESVETTADGEDETPPEGEHTDSSEGEIVASSADGTATSPEDGTATPPEDETQSGTDDIVEADDSPEAAETDRDRPPVPDPRPLSVRSGESRESTEEEDSADEDATVAAGEDRPSLSELRAELNDQFESIRVRAPGQYELNLMELYDREEYIIALQEDGKYTVQLPERWDEG